jgi:PAS domain S-box-containing protein
MSSEGTVYVHQKEAWNRFVVTGEIDSGVPSLISESWMRCKDLGFDPKTPPNGAILAKVDVERRIVRNRDFLTVALPIVAELQALVKGSSFLTLITDNDGVILEMLCDQRLRDAGLERNLVLGGVWNEERAGTGGIGLALRLGRAVQVVGSQHYFEKDHDLTCSAAPIFSYDGRLIGCLDMSGPSSEAHLHTLGMVVAASKAITNQLRIEEDHRQIWLANEYLKTVIESISDGVIAIDSSGRIKEINSEAGKILGTDAAQARGRDIQDLVGRTPLFKKVVADGKPVTDVETVMETGRGYIHCHTSAKPISLSNGQVVGAVATLKEMKKLQRVVNQITGAEARFTFADILGTSSRMQRAIHLAQVAARNMCTVLIQGESGTGKELFAQAIHNASLAGQPFVAVNCAAIPETLIESELFGYEGGAFTGASRNGRPGKFELANDGTIFLDEIGEMPLNIQTVLLRVLQERSVVRIGGLRSIPVNVRVIAATNKDLAAEAPKGNFRQDLFYRLNVFKIDIPPLRDIPTDVPIMVEHLISRISARFGKSVVGVSLPVLRDLQRYSWPGNVRQLENVIERAISLAEGDLIEEQHLADFLQEESPTTFSDFASDGDEPLNMEDVERRTILEALRHYGERQKAARSLGISRSTLYRRLKRYRVESVN